MRDSGSGRNQVGAALLAEQVADQAHTNGNGSSGFTLELFADLKAHLGRVAAAIEKQNDDTQRLWESIRPLPGIPVPQITTTNGSADFPELLGPRAGYWWFVIQANALTFSAGSVSLYRNNADDWDLVGSFPSSGYLTYSGSGLPLQRNQRLLFKANAVTGSVTPSLQSVIEVANWAVPAYLL